MNCFLRAILGEHTTEPVRPTHTWDCTPKVWGHDTMVRNVRGDEVDLTGWHPNAYEMAVGDFVVLRGDRGGTTRYKLTKFERFNDPKDMWSGTAVFAPRGEVA